MNDQNSSLVKGARVESDIKGYIFSSFRAFVGEFYLVRTRVYCDPQSKYFGLFDSVLLQYMKETIHNICIFLK